MGKTVNTGRQIAGDAYPNLLHVEGTDVSILKTVKGSSLADKTVRVALIYLLAKHSVGVDEVGSDEIRDVCKNQGCLDSSNFAGTLAGARQWVLLSGKTGSGKKTCKLTHPGRDHAATVSAEENGS